MIYFFVWVVPGAAVGLPGAAVLVPVPDVPDPGAPDPGAPVAAAWYALLVAMFFLRSLFQRNVVTAVDAAKMKVRTPNVMAIPLCDEVSELSGISLLVLVRYC